MEKEKSIYEKVLDVGELARKLDFEYRSKVENEKEKQVKKIINKPERNINIPYEAYNIFLKEEDKENRKKSLLSM